MVANLTYLCPFVYYLTDLTPVLHPRLDGIYIEDSISVRVAVIISVREVSFFGASPRPGTHFEWRTSQTEQVSSSRDLTSCPAQPLVKGGDTICSRQRCPGYISLG